ncbi:fasciclin domain-containing protein [Rhodoferax sp. OV413]|uniref:fasciclin domain-containing protein n=1 Tax=Rhodoferax sp. OV413 TaxID=1855285 RepID=UPI0025E4ABFA|nr:fasciclin domain-containing protein [Rhodoferax sp. OV413]
MPALSLPRRSLLVVAALTVGLSGCATVSQPVTVAETIATTPSLSTLNSLVVKAGLVDALKATGPFTVFAPNNDAFKKVPAKTLDELAANPDRLKAVLTFHVVPAKLAAAEVKNGNVKSLQGSNLALSKAGEFVTVEDAMGQPPEIMATNGVVHVIDAVLLPPAPAK